jgi:hypothetical protein
MPKTKVCSTCKLEQTISQFKPDERYECGYASQCRGCRLQTRRSWASRPEVAKHLAAYKANRYRKNISGERDKALARERRRRVVARDKISAYELRRRYGMSRNQYEALLARQQGVCAICRKACSLRKNLCVDHDHETGHIRGLLCVKCNSGIGAFADSSAIIRRAADYLDDTRTEAKAFYQASR